MNKVYAVTGLSGVGKTTVSSLLKIMTPGESVILCGDDCHRWERGSPEWYVYTHFDPVANDIDLDFSEIKTLKSGNPVFRKTYNHSTGKFEPPSQIVPKGVIIHEGLHTLKPGTPADTKIYVEATEDLVVDWKMRRDVNDRGYAKSAVLDIMERRKNDEHHITSQKSDADIVCSFRKDKTGKVVFSTTPHNELSTVYDLHHSFVSTCNSLGFDYEMVQMRGGNVSYAYNDKLVITSSGTPLSRVSMSKGYSICETSKVFFRGEEYYFEDVCSFAPGQSPPSMELAVHYNFSSAIPKCVIHLHPVYLNTILCSKEAERVIGSLYSAFSYTFLPYVPPGYHLGYLTTDVQQIVFLQNHGIFVASDNFDKALSTVRTINDMAKEWIEERRDHFVSSYDDATGVLFPDAAIYPEMVPISNQIDTMIRSCNLTPKYLTEQECQHLRDMKFEQYRKSL